MLTRDIHECQLICSEMMNSLNEVSKMWSDMGIFGSRRAERRSEWLKRHREIDRSLVKREKECLGWMLRHEKQLKDSVNSLLVDLKLELWHPPPGPLISSIGCLVNKNEELIALKNERLAKWNDLMMEFRSFEKQKSFELSYISPSSTIPTEKDIECLEQKLKELRPISSPKRNYQLREKSDKETSQLVEENKSDENNSQENPRIKELENDLIICLERLRRKEAELEAAKKIIALSRLH